MRLLGSGNPKTVKGEKYGFLTFILHLAPSDLSGCQVCPAATPGCRAACLNTAGRGRFQKTQNARIRKTKLFFQDRGEFFRLLVSDIEAGIRKGVREKLIPVFRLNGTSDLRFENYPVKGTRNIMELFPDFQFYDYSKLHNRRGLPENYHLTFSRADGNEDKARLALENGMNVAVVFSTKKGDPLPETYMGYPVHDADEHDLRFRDPFGIAGLRAKGKAKNDTTGFVVQVPEVVT